MTKKEIEQHVADTIRKAADAIDPTLNQTCKPTKTATSEKAQEEHQAALTSFQTVRKRGMNLSLAGKVLTEAEIEALQKNKKKDNK